MRKEKRLITRQQEVNLRRVEKSCHSCRYFRLRGDSSYCLFLGRILATSDEPVDLVNWSMTTICDAWKKRPKTWNAIATDDPFWFDRYITRQTQRRFRK